MDDATKDHSEGSFKANLNLFVDDVDVKKYLPHDSDSSLHSSIMIKIKQHKDNNVLA